MSDSVNVLAVVIALVVVSLAFSVAATISLIREELRRG